MLTTRPKLMLVVKVQLFLLKSAVVQALQFGHLTSIIGQVMPVTTISPSTIVPLGIELLDCDSVHLTYVTG